MKNDMNENYRTEGRSAFDRGVNKSACPYEWESKAGKNWRAGYILGIKEADTIKSLSLVQQSRVNTIIELAQECLNSFGEAVVTVEKADENGCKFVMARFNRYAVKLWIRASNQIMTEEGKTVMCEKGEVQRGLRASDFTSEIINGYCYRSRRED